MKPCGLTPMLWLLQEESLIIKPATKMQTPSAIYMHTLYTLWQYKVGRRQAHISDLQQQQKAAPARPDHYHPALMQRCMRALHY